MFLPIVPQEGVSTSVLGVCKQGLPGTLLKEAGRVVLRYLPSKSPLDPLPNVTVQSVLLVTAGVC